MYMDKYVIYDIEKDGLPNEDEDVLVYDHGRWYVASFTGRYAEISERDNAGNYLTKTIPVTRQLENNKLMFVTDATKLLGFVLKVIAPLM